MQRRPAPISRNLLYRFRPSRRVVPVTLVALATVLVLTLLAGCGRVRDADNEYELVLEQIEQINERVGEDEFFQLTAEDMAWLQDEFEILSERIETIRGLSTAPLGLDGILSHEDFGSARYRATMDMLEVARLMAESGRIIASIGEETLNAFEASGFRADPSSNADTWLDVMVRREAELNEALDLMDDALQLREELDEDELPGRVHVQLARIDDMTDRFAEQRELFDDLPLITAAMGAEGPIRYLVLFQNPAELRPTGGFPGTSAIIEVHRGQISDYQFQDTAEIATDHMQYRDAPVPAPWAIQRYVRQDGLQIYDANWWAEFPVSAQMISEMLEVARWPTVDGVVAVQPEVIGAMLAITGSVEVEVDGEIRVVTSENLYDEVERQRRLISMGEVRETYHKDVAAQIAENILAELGDLDRDDLVESAFMLFDALDRRDMQAFSYDESVQAMFVERNWAGLRVPEPDTPTISAAFANIQGLKTSLTMQPEILLAFEHQGTGEPVLVNMTLVMWNLGDEDEDPLYEGFQRWWLDVALPDDANNIRFETQPANDPDASNGGAYIVDLEVGERKEIILQFELPDIDRLMVRRQPGLVNMLGNASFERCDEPVYYTVSQDILLQLAGDCPAVEPLKPSRVGRSVD